jgi:transcriptional regulator with XRE-family HTH domain
LAHLTQAGLARKIGVSASAAAQWELPDGTSPNTENLIKIAVACEVSFEWLATSRGSARSQAHETPAVDAASFAVDHVEDRLLLAFRRIGARKREAFVRWMEEFF